MTDRLYCAIYRSGIFSIEQMNTLDRLKESLLDFSLLLTILEDPGYVADIKREIKGTFDVKYHRVWSHIKRLELENLITCLGPQRVKGRNVVMYDLTDQGYLELLKQEVLINKLQKRASNIRRGITRKSKV